MGPVSYTHLDVYKRQVLEYNARFGDPEAQVVLPRMKNDIIDVMEACVDGKLDAIDLQFEDNAAVCVVLASDGYPVAYEKGFEITGLEKFEGKEDYFCFHAGTKFNEAGKIVTNGGRVLGITATAVSYTHLRIFYPSSCVKIKSSWSGQCRMQMQA